MMRRQWPGLRKKERKVAKAPRMAPISLSINADDLRRLKRVCTSRKMSVATFVREAIRRSLRYYGE